MPDGSFGPFALAAIKNRSHGLCSRCFAARGTQAHHRQPRGSGGTSLAAVGSPANGLWLCHPCHHWIEHNRADALALGLLVSKYQDPAGVPAHLRLPYAQRWYTLLDDGTVEFLHDLEDPPPHVLP